MTPTLAAFALAALWCLAWAPFFWCCCEPPSCAELVFSLDCGGLITVARDGEPVPLSGTGVPGELTTGPIPAGTYDWALSATCGTEADSGSAEVECGEEVRIDIVSVAKAGYGKDRLGLSSNVNRCCCVGPDAMTLTSSDTLIEFGNYQNATITWQAVPAALSGLGLFSPYGYWSEEIPDYLGQLFRYLVHCLGGNVVIVRVWEDYFGAPAVSNIIWTWAPSASGRCNTRAGGPEPVLYENSCCPLALLSGTPTNTMNNTTCFQLFE